MKIAHVSTVHPSNDVRVFHKMCKTLVQSGHDVTLVINHDKDEVIDGVQIRALSRPASRLRRFVTSGFKALKVARREGPDVYHLHDPELLPWALLLRLTGRRVIFDMHENLPAAISSKGWIAGWLRKPLARAVKFFEKLAFRYVPVIFAEHSYSREYTTARSHETVLNLPVVEELAAIERTRNPAFSLVYVGRVADQRGSLTTLEAIKRIDQTPGPSVEFECIGGSTPGHEKELHDYVSRHNLEGVRLHGRLHPADAWDKAASCHLGLAMLHPVSNYLESYPTKMFEYMALGIPVLVSNFPLYDEIIQQTGAGKTADPLDPESIADTIRWFMEHPQEAREMGRKGREAAMSDYSWHHEAKKLLAFYERVAS